MNIAFVGVPAEDAEAIARLSALATRIVRAQFDPLVGREQNTYMLRRFQTPEAITSQIQSGFHYFFVLASGQEAGFLAFFPKNGKMDLSKFYLDTPFRGKGFARAMFDFVCGETRKAGLPSVLLNVNRNNAGPIAVYRHLGFYLLRAEKNDIGCGYIMDDYVLQYDLPQEAGES